jgi:hypothetical protein
MRFAPLSTSYGRFFTLGQTMIKAVPSFGHALWSAPIIRWALCAGGNCLIEENKRDSATALALEAQEKGAGKPLSESADFKHQLRQTAGRNFSLMVVLEFALLHLH